MGPETGRRGARHLPFHPQPTALSDGTLCRTLLSLNPQDDTPTPSPEHQVTHTYSQLQPKLTCAQAITVPVPLDVGDREKWVIEGSACKKLESGCLCCLSPSRALWPASESGLVIYIWMLRGGLIFEINLGYSLKSCLKKQWVRDGERGVSIMKN